MSEGSSKNDTGNDQRLQSALQEARLREAAHFSARMDIRDAQTLRLSVLYEDLAPVIAANRRVRDFVDLALVPGDPPRLWIDLITYVEMAPDPQTFQLKRDAQSGPQVLFETRDRAAIVPEIIKLVAHRAISRERLMVEASGAEKRTGYGVAALILAWLSGLALGVLGLFSLGVWLSKTPL